MLMHQTVVRFRGAGIALVLALAGGLLGSAFVGSASAGGGVTVSPRNVRFEPTTVNQLTLVALTVTNQTGSAVFITGDTLEPATGSFFSEFDQTIVASRGSCFDSSLGYLLQAGESCTYLVGFYPGSHGRVSQSATIEFSGGAAVRLRLTGFGSTG